MAFYGELIDPSYDPNKDNIYNAFSEYFENPMMTKIKDVNEFSVYMAKMHCLLSTVHRYVIIFVDNDGFPVGNTESLSKFKWIFLQTRELTDNHNIQPQRYKPRRYKLLMKNIQLINKSPENYTYSVEDYPLKVNLLPKTNDQMEYQPSGNVITALETFSTIISWI